MFRRIAAISIAAIAAIATIAPAQAQVQVAGSYAVEGDCNGVDPYVGTLIISGSGPVYTMRWRVGPDTFQGTALERDGVLAIAYASTTYTGLMQTRPQGKGWNGIWTVEGSTTVCSERWTRD